MISISRLLIITLAATALPSALHAQTAPASASASAPAAKTVSVTATLEALDSADLYAKDAGYLSGVKADMGDHVKQGQVLAIIDDPELQKQFASSQANVEARNQMALAAQALVQQSEKNRDVVKTQLAGFQAEEALALASLKRQEATSVISEQERDEGRAKTKVAAAQTLAAQSRIAAADADVTAAQANLAVARSQVTVAQAETQRLQTLLQYTQVTAPFDGVITRRLVSTGDMVQSGAANRTTPLFTCQRIDTIRVFCDVPEAQSAAIAPGMSASVRIFALDNLVVTGTVTRIAMSLNATTRTMRAEIDLPNPGEKLRPGMYAQVTLTLAPPKP